MEAVKEEAGETLRPTKGETTTLTFDFSEPVTGFTASDISLSPKIGTLGPLVQDSSDFDHLSGDFHACEECERRDLHRRGTRL